MSPRSASTTAKSKTAPNKLVPGLGKALLSIAELMKANNIDQPLTSTASPKSGKRSDPLWTGPSGEGPNGGITFSLLSRFLCCRERFRVHAIEGLRAADTFNHYLEYGTMWHLCEEALAEKRNAWEPYAHELLIKYVEKLCNTYPMQREQIEHWSTVCLVQFPIYADYCKAHFDNEVRKPVLQEVSFDVPYELGSGRVVRLRGRWDAAYRLGEGPGKIYLQENKTKGEINEGQLRKQLKYDMQTMLYLVALRRNYIGPIGGVIYNVVRRPLSGGKGSIRRHEPTKSNPRGESWDSFYARLSGVIKENADTFFMRWRVEILQTDIDKFVKQTLNPLLEEVCDWYEGVTGPPHNLACQRYFHYRHPFGIRNMQDEGIAGDLDEYLDSGSQVGLRRVDNLFPEL